MTNNKSYTLITKTEKSFSLITKTVANFTLSIYGFIKTYLNPSISIGFGEFSNSFFASLFRKGLLSDFDAETLGTLDSNTLEDMDYISV